MRLFGKYKIRIHLIFVFVVLVIVSGSAGLYGTIFSQSLVSQQQAINKANNVNSNAARDIRASLFRMHRSMKDAVLSQQPDEAITALGMVTKDDQFVISKLNQLQRTYDGDPLLLNILRDDFAVWRTIRQRVATLQKEGRKAEAISITQHEGADLVDQLDQETRNLIVAITKAHMIAEQKITVQQRRMSHSLAGILLGAAFLILSTGLHTGYRLLQPVHVLV